MKEWLQKFALWFSVGMLLGSPVKSHAFALLGPAQPWMQATNGVIQPGDIGGPMFMGNGYRWNVPVLTYGFDQSFLDYFGTNGVAAVTGAIQVLNNLPPASRLVLANYPFDSRHVNYEAQSQSLVDLKSATLSLLLEQMGLAEPARETYVLREWNSALATNDPESLLSEVFDGTNLSDFIVPMNYDPQNLNATPYVNQTLYAALVETLPGQSYIYLFTADPLAVGYNAVADNFLNQGDALGGFYKGLTYDDVGGLTYLLSTNNVNYENLLPGVIGSGTNIHSYANGAWRPGVDKITFIPQPIDSKSGAFLTTTNYYTDSYITNGVRQQQQLARIIIQPDFIFSANDLTYTIPIFPFYTRTGTTNWLNNATANGNTNGAGPGVIQPPVHIVFNKSGRQLLGDGTVSGEEVTDESAFWGSFDDTTNAPVSYPIPQTTTSQMVLRMWLTVGQTQTGFDWTTNSAPGTQYALQTSTNLTNWTTLFTVTNNGSASTFFDYPTSASRFYRFIPQ